MKTRRLALSCAPLTGPALPGVFGRPVTAMFVTLVTVVHVFVCIFLILVILLQAGKDGGMGSALGGGGSGSVFGGRGAGSFLGKVTAACAGLFFVTSLTLSFAASYQPSVTAGVEAPAPAAKKPAAVEPKSGAPAEATPSGAAGAAPEAPSAPPAQ